MNNVTKRKKQEIMKSIGEASAPPMSKEDAVEFLDELMADIEASVDCLRQEIKAGGG